MEEYRNKRNHFRDEAGRIQESLQEQYIQENTVQMNLNSMSDKRAEIKQGYENLKRENAELEKQTKEIEENSQSIQLEMEASASQESALEKSINEKQEKARNGYFQGTGKESVGGSRYYFQKRLYSGKSKTY